MTLTSERKTQDNIELTKNFAKLLRIDFQTATEELEEYRDPVTDELQLPPGYTYVLYGVGIDFVDLGGASEGSGHN